MLAAACSSFSTRFQALTPANAASKLAATAQHDWHPLRRRVFLRHAPPMLFSIHHLPSIASQAAEKLSGIRVTSPPSVTNLGAPFIQACGRLSRPGVGITDRFMRLRGPNKTNGACPSRRLTLVLFFFPCCCPFALHIAPFIFLLSPLRQQKHISAAHNLNLLLLADPPQFADARLLCSSIAKCACKSTGTPPSHSPIKPRNRPRQPLVCARGAWVYASALTFWTYGRLCVYTIPASQKFLQLQSPVLGLPGPKYEVLRTCSPIALYSAKPHLESPVS